MDRGWMLRAACIGMPPSWWDAESPELSDANHAAVAVCGGCPVRAQCFDDAVEDRAEMVIRGGCRFGGLKDRHVATCWCGVRFLRRHLSMYCSERCRNRAQYQRRRAVA